MINQGWYAINPKQPNQPNYIYIYIYTGWNDKIVALEKTTRFHFRWMKTGFLFLLQTIY